MEVTNYQCPACTGPLHYVGSTGKLQCDYCGSTYSVEEIEELYKKKQEAAEEAYAQGEEERAAPEDTGFDESEMTEDWGEDAAHMRSYNCPSCGAQLICDETTAATACPYCGNPTVVPGVFSQELKPDFVIPFKLDQQEAEQALRNFYKGKRLLPKNFAAENKIKELKGVYVPFWLYDGEADVDASFSATRSETHTEGDYRVTNTRHYRLHRSGSVRFQKVPVDASSKMPDEYMDDVEPFDYIQLTEFSLAYLPGFLADKYDVSSADCGPRARARAVRTALDEMSADISGYDTVTRTREQVGIRQGKVHYALLPVYLLSTKWQGTDYLFAMNGQTGRMIGRLPISWGRFWGWFAGIALPTFAAMSLLLSLLLS